MKIAFASDIHLEFGNIDIKNTEGAEVLVLAGDILVAYHLKHHESCDRFFDKYERCFEFFNNISKEFNHILYVIGNHEHYDGDFNSTIPLIKETFGHIKNLHVLDNGSITLGDVTFIGGTMWTSMNNDDPLVIWKIANMMNDFRIIDNGNYTFSPNDAANEHKKFINFASEEMKGKDKVVMITHHSPSFSTVHEEYKDEHIMNHGYCSNLDNFIMDNPNIKAWIYGHQHNRFDKFIGETRILNNSRGYARYEECSSTFELKYVDI